MIAILIIIGILFLENLINSHSHQYPYHRSKFQKYHWDMPYDDDYEGYGSKPPFHHKHYEQTRDRKALYYTFMFLAIIIALLILMKK